ncbi:hypothetical protein RhiirB3_532974 [Rhizophagus irregularis]|nr:hypothetical protein RhiirB3_532974 [Rhizophagus irregularis]
MVILNYRSSYLRRILSTNFNKSKDDRTLTHIKLPNILPEIFQMILRYIYGARLSLEEYDTSDIVKILIASSELNLQELITHLQLFLIENKKDWMKQNFNLIYKTSFENNSFLKLRNFCTELMSKEPEKVFNSIDFISLSENCLISLIQHDNFQMSDIQAISKEISPESIDSRIITFQHVELISKWIDKLKTTGKIKNLYEFKLILRGSRDGFSSNKFHEICDGQSHTISVIKVKDSNEILGGYNPLAWNSKGGYVTTKDSFIFSFKNRENIKNYVLSRVWNNDNAVYNHTAYGPSFGSDLTVHGNNCYDKSYCSYWKDYDKFIRKTNDYFSIEEYEIFQIMKE